MEKITAFALRFLAGADRLLSKHMCVWGVLLSLLIAAAQLLRNISSGPLYNLNDIGGWHNRLIFLVLAFGAHALVMLLCVFRHRASGGRLFLRMALLALTFEMCLLAINQKTYYYTEQIQPLVLSMKEGGLACIPGLSAALSVPALELLMLITQGPVYDMYLVKLVCIVCWQILCLMLCSAAEQRRPSGLTAEAVLLMSLILPQGFLSAACASQTEILALLLLCLSFGSRKPLQRGLLFGIACALSGVCLLALPFVFIGNKKEKLYGSSIALFAYAFLMLPAIIRGMNPAAALCSPLKALLDAPPYASGAPNLMGFFPRAAAMEMPEAALLKHVQNLDLVTNDSPFYTQEHFEVLMRGLALTGLGCYIGTAWYANEKTTGLRRILILTSAALFCVPGASMAAWLAVDLLCIAAIVFEPNLRFPACLLLFATAGGCAYPVAGETLVYPAYAAGLVLAALLMLLFPGKKKEML